MTCCTPSHAFDIYKEESLPFMPEISFFKNTCNHKSDEITIHKAAINGHLDTVKILLDFGTDINQELQMGAYQIPPIYCAMYADNYLEMVDFFIVSGADVNYELQGGYTPLSLAIMLRHLDVIKMLVANGANVNAKINNDFGYLYIIHLAITTNNTQMVNFLIENGADINVRTKNKSTPFHYAVAVANIEIVRLLLDKGMDVNAENNEKFTPLHYLLGKKIRDERIYELFECILERGANSNVLDESFRTPLYYAAKSADDRLVALLIKYGADVNAKNNENKTPLHVAAQDGYYSIVKILIQNGADVNVKMVKNITPLHSGVRGGNLDIVKFLLTNGAYFDVKTKKKGTCSLPIEYAKKNGNTPIYKLLEITTKLFEAIKKNDILEVKKYLEEGALINCVSVRFQTPLHYASELGLNNIVDFLLKSGANINFTDSNNLTALHQAVKFNHLETVLLLLEHGAMFDVCIKEGKMPIDFAPENNDIFHLLQLIKNLFEKIKNNDPEAVQELNAIKTENLGKFKTIMRVRNNQGMTLIQIASISNHKDTARLLVSMLS